MGSQESGGTWVPGTIDAKSHVWGKADTRIIGNTERSGVRTGSNW